MLSASPPATLETLPAGALAGAGAKSSRRIDVIDALRGFALAGILLLHHVERFNFFFTTWEGPAWTLPYNSDIWDTTAFLFSGKSYAVFSVLFGFSFWMMYSKRQEQGEPFAGRFMWRVFLLACFGYLHSFVYSGDLLTAYALFAGVVVLARRWSDRAVFALSLFLLLQPQFWWRTLMLLYDGDYTLPTDFSGTYLVPISEAIRGGTFWAWLRANVENAMLSNMGWMWYYGRMCHIPGFFLLGMLACRRKVFTGWSSRRWAFFGGAALLAWIPMYRQTEHLREALAGGPLRDTVLLLGSAYQSLALTAVAVSLFILAWRTGLGARLLSFLIPYGRMSLTNYVAGSFIGGCIYYNWGLRVYPYGTATICLLIGLGMLALHLVVSHLWIRRFGQGPLERLWRRLTWLGYANRNGRGARPLPAASDL